MDDVPVRSYPISRTILGITQAAGWVLAVIGFILGTGVLLEGINQEVGSVVRRVNISQGLTVLIGSLFAAGINHALIAIGLGIFDQVEVQRQSLAEQMQATRCLHDILSNLRGEEKPASMVTAENPPAKPTPAPIPVMIPKDGTTLLEPHVQDLATIKPLVISGDLPASRPLGEADLERLEAEHRRRSLPKP